MANTYVEIGPENAIVQPTDIPFFDTFADLPGVATTDDLAYVRTTTGVFLINRNKRGIYRYTGSAWEFGGDSVQSAGNTSYDNTSSLLVAATSQAAIDELDGIVDGLPTLDGAFCLTASRGNGNSTDLWLRRPDNTPLNLSPYVLPFDATIVAVTAAGNAAETWDGEVYRNSDVRTGGVPSDANKLTEVVVTAADAASVSVSVDVDAGDELGIFMRGSSIDRPSVTIYLVRR